MRIAFPLIALAVGAALGWFFLMTEPPSSMPLDSALHQAEPTVSPETSASASLAEPTLEAALPQERTQDFEGAAPGAAEVAIRWDELELLGRVVNQDEVPLSGYTVLVARTGLKPSKAGVIPAGQRCVTDAQGHCDFSGLSEPGPWDVYAFPMDLGVERSSLHRNARIGTVTAKNPGEAERVTFTLSTGPLVVLRSPLPEGVAAEDLWFEALPRKSHQELIAAAHSAPAYPARRYTQGVLSEEGYVTALLSAGVPSSHLRGYSVHVRTRDGRYALLAARDTPLPSAQEVVIDESLEPRGRVRIRLAVRDLRKNVSDAPGEPGEEGMRESDWREAAQAVDWQLLLEDPARSGDEQPSGYRTVPQNRPWVRTGADTFELADLPLGIPMEIGAIGQAADQNPFAAFVPETLLQAVAVHGDPEPLEVRIRRVR